MLTPDFPNLNESFAGARQAIEYARKKNFGVEFRHGVWVASGYPASLGKPTDPGMPDPVERKIQTLDSSEEDINSYTYEQVMEHADRVECKMKESNEGEQPQVKQISPSVILILIKLAIRLGQIFV